MGHEIDRRSFIKWVAAAAAVLLTPLAYLVGTGTAFGTSHHTGFRFSHDESIAIVLDFAKSPDRYDLTVRQNGEDVEVFRNADPMRFHRLRTDFFEVEYFDPVAA